MGVGSDKSVSMTLHPMHAGVPTVPPGGASAISAGYISIGLDLCSLPLLPQLPVEAQRCSVSEVLAQSVGADVARGVVCPSRCAFQPRPQALPRHRSPLALT